MNEEVAEFSREFHDEIRAEAHAIEALREEVFVQKMGDILEEYGEIDDFVPCSYRTTGMKIDGYCYNDEFQAFILIVSHFLDEADPYPAHNCRRTSIPPIPFLDSVFQHGPRVLQ